MTKYVARHLGLPASPFGLKILNMPNGWAICRRPGDERLMVKHVPGYLREPGLRGPEWQVLQAVGLTVASLERTCTRGAFGSCG
jgi:hypothetical protein